MSGLNSVTRLEPGDDPTAESTQHAIFELLHRWKQIDISVTEAANEAKDNVKYLATLDKFIEPLYSGTPVSILDTVPSLLNSIKMIHTIARYYNTTERMTHLFTKITNQMISNCKNYVFQDDAPEKLWSGIRSGSWSDLSIVLS